MKRFGFLLMAGLMVLAGSCGYQFQGRGYINKDVTRVAVEVFGNKSSETTAGVSFANELIREILEKTDTQVVDSDKAGRKINGTINSITFSGISRTSIENVVERQVTARVDVQLVGADGKILWSVKNFTSSEDYAISKDEANDARNRQEAIDKIARRSAQQLVGQMTSHF